MRDALRPPTAFPRNSTWPTGYAKLAGIKRVTRLGMTVYVPARCDTARDRHARRPNDLDAVADWRARMCTDHAEAIYKERAATAEGVNAQARNRGFTRLLVRGVDKIKATACW